MILIFTTIIFERDLILPPLKDIIDEAESNEILLAIRGSGSIRTSFNGKLFGFILGSVHSFDCPELIIFTSGSEIK